MGGVFCKKVKNGGCFFVNKWTFPQRRVHYAQYQYFLFYILLIWGGTVRTKRSPPCLRAWLRQRAAGLPLAGDVDRLLHDAPCSGRRVPQHAARRSAANASSVTFTAAVEGRTQTWFKHVFHLQVQNTNYSVNK